MTTVMFELCRRCLCAHFWELHGNDRDTSQM